MEQVIAAEEGSLVAHYVCDRYRAQVMDLPGFAAAGSDCVLSDSSEGWRGIDDDDSGDDC